MPRNDAQPGAKAKSAARRLKVLEYRKAGLTFRQIAERLSTNEEEVSFQQVHRDYKKAMKEIVLATQSTKEEMIALQTERLEMACASLVGKVAKGEIGAIKTWIKISESIRKLYGLDKPIQIEDVTPPKPKLDYSKLSVMELRLLEELLSKAQPIEGQSDDSSDDGEDEDDE